MKKSIFAIVFVLTGFIGILLTWSSFFLPFLALDDPSFVDGAIGVSLALYAVVIIQIAISFLRLKKSTLSPYLSLIGLTYFIPFWPSFLAMLPIFIIGLAAKDEKEKVDG